VANRMRRFMGNSLKRFLKQEQKLLMQRAQWKNAKGAK